MRKLSRREAHRLAFHYAINERDSFAGAYDSTPDDPAATRAAWLASEFRRGLKEEFGEITTEDHMIANPGPSVSIFALVERKP